MLARLLKQLSLGSGFKKEPDGLTVLDIGNTVPTDATSGYAIGCVFIHTDGAAGTTLYINEGSATSCDFNASAALTAAQEALLGATAGTITANKAVVVDANKDAGDFRNLDAVNVDAGASGTAGTVDVFPTTASKGKLTISCTDQTGDTSVTLKPAGMGQATVLTIPDPGHTVADVALGHDMAEGAGFDETGTICEHVVTKGGGLIKTEILLDLTGLTISASAGDIIGDEGDEACHFGQIVAAVNGTIKAGKVTCLETPAGGDTDIDFYSGDEGTGALTAEDAAASGLTNATQLINHGAWAAGEMDELSALPGAAQYLYAVGQAGGDTEYTAGIFLIELWGV